MHSGNTHTPGRRAGFTLIELLVVITIIIVLAGLALALLPTANDHQKATQGAGMVQGWLLIAKQRALRDQMPRGIRLLYDPDGFCRQLQYIEQPDDFSGGQATTTPPGAVAFTGVDLTGGFTDPTQYLVQPGDLFETPIQGTPPGGSLHQITAVSGPQALTVNASNPLPPAVGTSSYRIVRMPRPAVADPTLNLPKDIAIDPPTLLGGRTIITPDTRNGVPFYDIMFSPSGPVMRQGQLNGRIILWVHDISLDGLQGDQTLITVYTRTGLIAGHPANPANGYATPYTYTQDGRSSGL
jgi:prepilin-type N-terminal cleavage/methylation domain-containing protein